MRDIQNLGANRPLTFLDAGVRPFFRAVRRAVRLRGSGASSRVNRCLVRPPAGRIFPWLALLFVLPTGVLAARTPAGPDGPFRPLRTDRPPVVDGRLDDPVWREAPSVSGFETFIPDFGREPSERTTAWMAYDAENLYFAFKCYDREPGKIKAAVANRDTIRTDDFICINLDSFNDQQSLYAFYVNPLGIQTDSRFASGQEDLSVDFVWSSAGRLDPDGYSVELRIPFKSIRYAGKARVEMSIFFERRISRLSEHGSYPPLDPKRGYAFLTQMMPFELLDIKNYTLLEVLPAFTYSQRHDRSEETGDLVRQDPARDLSLTAKYGITPQLILDGTVNPDFSQVEADAGQVDVNLRYDLYFPEKRPFFLEGSEMFLLAGTIEGDPLQSVVYTRTIIDPRLGFKLSGKIGRRDTVASILALDEAPSLEPGFSGTERYAGSAIVRYKRSLSGDGYLGGFYTGREWNGGSNQLAGLDGQFRLGPSSLLGVHGFGSRTRPGRDAGDGAERANGSALGLDYLYDTRNLGVSLGFQSVSRGFETASGYLTRNGLTRFRAAVLPRLYPKSRVFRKLTVQAAGSVLKDLWSGLYEGDGGLTLQLLLPGNTTAAVSGVLASEIFLARRFDTSGWQAVLQSQVTKKLSVRAQFRGGRKIGYEANPYQGTGSAALGTVTYLPSDKLNVSLSLTYSDLYRDGTAEKVFDYTITRGRLTYQVNRYLFFRGIVEYNAYWKELLTDFLASFTYIPGTVIQFGYGSLYNRLEWREGGWVAADRFNEMTRGLFFKASYLWRL